MAGLPRASIGNKAGVTDKRFRRAHVKPGRKRSSIARRAWIVARATAALGLFAYAAYHGATIITAAPVADGVRIQVRARRSERIGALQRETLARAKRLASMSE